MNGNRSIPATIADITPEWMTGVLRDAGFPAVTVQSMSQSESQGGGAGSDSGVLNLTYSEATPDAPDSVFVKVVTTSAGAGAIMDDIGFYESEADFYNGPGRNPGIRVPRAYFAAYQPEPLRYVSVIENITDATGRSIFDDVHLSDLTAVVRTMAQLHAYWWGSDELSPYVGKSKFYDAGRLETVFSNSWPASREFAVEHMPANAVEAGDLLLGNVERVLGPLLSKTPTLRHGDFHVENVLFPDGQNGSDGPDIIVIDWQTWSPGDPSIDLSTLIVQCVRFEKREEYESILLDVYLSELSMRGVNDYSMDELLVDYRRSMAFMLVRFAFILALMGTPGLTSDDPDLRERMGRRARTWGQDYGGAIVDHDLLGMLRDEL